MVPTTDGLREDLGTAFRFLVKLVVKSLTVNSNQQFFQSCGNWGSALPSDGIARNQRGVLSLHVDLWIYLNVVPLGLDINL